MIKTIIFDMDGVIFDTERRMKIFWQKEADRLGLGDIEDFYAECIGSTESYCQDSYAARYPNAPSFHEFLTRTFEMFSEMNEKEGMPLKPGIRELLIYLKEHGYRIGLASSTRKALVEKELQMEDLHSYFDVIVGGDQLKRSKPAPDIYLMACEEIGTDPSEAYAVEDSYNGIRSASSAGMKTIMIPDLLPPTPEIAALCTAVIEDLPAFQQYLKRNEDVRES